MKLFCAVLLLQIWGYHFGYYMGTPSEVQLHSTYCRNIDTSGVDISDDCSTAVDCRGTARVYSCRHSNLQLSGSSCVNTTGSECTRKLQG